MRRRHTSLIQSAAAPRHVRQHEVGGKAFHLFALQRSGFPVPPWVVVPAGVFAAQTNGTRGDIARCIQGIDFHSRESVADASRRIREMIRRVPLPEQLLREIAERARTLSHNGSGLSVRSSAVGEDSHQHSFAGQLESFLNVPHAGLAEAIKSVWASAFTERALIYRKKKGLPLDAASTAVIVQQMIDCRVSGVAFSRHPDSGTPECVISAGLGWGEGIVNDLVATDTYHIDWRSDAIRKEVVLKKTRVTAAAAGSGSALSPVPRAEQGRPALTDAQIRQLRDLVVHAEHCFGEPQDVEWGVDGHDRLFILQARPITCRPACDTGVRNRIWDNSNIVESYPGLTLPLTFSFIRNGYESAFQAAARGLVLFKKEMRRHQPVFANMIGLIRGRVYYNLLNWYTMLSFLPAARNNRRSWDQMIGIRQPAGPVGGRLSRVNRAAAALSMLYRLIAVRRTASRFFRAFDGVYRKYHAVDFDALSADAAADLYDALTREFMSAWHLTLYNDFSAMKYYDWLKRLCDHHTLRTHPNLHNDLLCGRNNVESVAPAASLAELARMFTDVTRRAGLPEQIDDQTVWEHISNDPQFAVLRHALTIHIDRFGDRGLEELKLDSPSLRDEPARLIARIREWSRLGLSPEDVRERERAIRDRAAETLRRGIRNPLRRMVMNLVLSQARRAISNRENMRFARSRVYGLVRRLFARLGTLFAASGVIETQRDIHYLTVDEVLSMIRGTNVTHDTRSLVSLRRTEYGRFADDTLPPRFETTDIPALDRLSECCEAAGSGRELTGIGCSSGIVQGVARIVDDPQSVQPNHDAVLIADSTDPGWVFLMVTSKGIVVERGSVLSHTAIIGRELGIPTIVGAVGARRLIPDGTHIRIDGSTGVVRWN